ncbi:MAG TPA: TolC family protein, partial [Chryseolinea sp.]|nr:TolC family protein [Chryseolinea sp.]
VQKPLATVVIGGLISATLLTLIVLPLLYLILETRILRSLKSKTVILLIGFLVLNYDHADAQQQKLSLSQMISLATEKSATLNAAEIETDRQRALKKSSTDIPKTDVSLMYGQYNSIQKTDNNITINQGIPFPTVFVRHNMLSNELIKSFELRERVTSNEIAFKVKHLFNELLYLKEWHQVLLTHDSLLQELSRAAAVQYRTGEGTLLVKTLTETQYAEMKNQLARNNADIRIALDHLRLLCQTPDLTDIDGRLDAFIDSNMLDTAGIMNNPVLAAERQQVKVNYQLQKLEAARAMPDLHIGYFNQTLIGTQNVDGQETYFGSNKRFQGFQAGISLPLWFVPYSSRVKAAKLATSSAQKFVEGNEMAITQQYHQAQQELLKNKASLDYYNSTALNTADLLMTQGKKSFQSGELDFTTLLLTMRQSLSIQEGYLNAWHAYNESMIAVQYLTGGQISDRN